MKTLLKNILAFVLIAFLANKAHAQNSATNTNGQVVTTQPKIMVIPYAKEGEDLRTLLETDVNKRLAITKIKEGFDTRGFTTVDFVTKLKAAKDNNTLTAENQADIKTQIIQMSGADVFVQAEVDILKTPSGNSVNMILHAYEASTGNSLSNKIGESGKFYTDDFGKLATKAVDNCIEDFLNVIQSKFTDIVNNGRSVIVEVSFAQDSQYNMSSELGTDMLPLSDLLEEWMGENAFKNNYHIQGTTDLKMIFDDVRIPLKNQATGNNYNPSQFSSALLKHLKSLGLEASRVQKGNTILFTVK